MNAHVIERQFDKIGARAKIHADPDRFGGTVLIDIDRDGDGEFFDIGVGRTRDLDVVDARPRIRHLLLMLCGLATVQLPSSSPAMTSGTGL